MDTKVVKIDKEQIDDEKLMEAAEILRAGGLVAFPTETVYGLGANALNEEAAKKIYAAKGRPSDNPLIAHISKPEELAPLVKEVPEEADGSVLAGTAYHDFSEERYRAVWNDWWTGYSSDPYAK